MLSGRRDHAPTPPPPPVTETAAVGRLSLLDGSQADLKDLRVVAPSSTLGSTTRRARGSRAVLLLLGVKTNVFGALELEDFPTAHLVGPQSERAERSWSWTKWSSRRENPVKELISDFCLCGGTVLTDTTVL